jgi:putative endonuclease
MTKIILGQKGEQLVVNYLLADGFVIKARNYRQRCGEVDIIAERDDLLVFVEVKLRQQRYFDLSEVITPGKQRRIIMATKDYLMRNQVEDRICRFDVALVETKLGVPEIDYIPNAFVEEW